jgi:hypothetical protein
MNYLAHMTTGAVIPIEVDDSLKGTLFYGGEANAIKAEWLVGNGGEMINMAFCAALVPVIEPDESPASTAKPRKVIIDSDGDAWIENDDGLFRFAGISGRRERSREYVEDAHGITREYDAIPVD